MNEIIKSKLVEILNAATSVGADAYEFVKAQAPELAKEIVMTHAIDNLPKFGTFAVLLVLFVVVATKITRSRKPGDGERAFLSVLVWMVCALLFLGLSYSASEIAKCYFTPRVVFIEEAKNIMR